MRIFIIGILATLALTACATPAQQQAATIRSVAQATMNEFRQCTSYLYSEPQYAPLLPRLPQPQNNFLPTMAQMSDNTYPTQSESQLLIAFHDDAARCKQPAIQKIESVAPNLAVVLADAEIEGDRITLQLVKRQITWGQAATQRQAAWAENNRRLVAADQELANNLNAENRAELAQRQQAANALMQWSLMQQAINAANRPVVTTCSDGGAFVNCVSH